VCTIDDLTTLRNKIKSIEEKKSNWREIEKQINDDKIMYRLKELNE
jgi:hypothetical protein